MSHFTKISKAEIVDAKAFSAACEELGFEGIKFDVEITDFYKNKITVEVAIPMGKYDIGLQKNERDTYDMIADWWGLMQERARLPEKAKKCRSESELQNLLLKYTTKHTIVRKYKKQGWRARVTEDEEENLNVELQKA